MTRDQEHSSPGSKFVCLEDLSVRCYIGIVTRRGLWRLAKPGRRGGSQLSTSGSRPPKSGRQPQVEAVTSISRPGITLRYDHLGAFTNLVAVFLRRRSKCQSLLTYVSVCPRCSCCCLYRRGQRRSSELHLDCDVHSQCHAGRAVGPGVQSQTVYINTGSRDRSFVRQDA
jgi:hypothetical protein